MQALRDGRDVVLAFNRAIGTTLKAASIPEFDNDAIVLKQAANIIRKDIFKRKNSSGLHSVKLVSKMLLYLVSVYQDHLYLHQVSVVVCAYYSVLYKEAKHFP